MTTLPQTTSIRLPRPSGGGALAVPAGPAANTSVGMTAGDVWRVIRANTWLLVITIVLGAAAGAGLNMYLAKNSSRYTATGLVMIPQKRTGNIYDGLNYVLDTNTLTVELKSQAQLLHTESLFNAVLNRDDVRATEWFKHFVRPGADGVPVPDIAAAKDDLADKLTVNPLQESNLIQVQFTYRNPKDCATIVNELVQQHLENQTDLKSNDNKQRVLDLNYTKNTLNQKSLSLKDQISGLEAELAKAGIATVPGHYSSGEMELMSLSDQARAATMALSAANSELDMLKARLQEGLDPVEVDQLVDEDGHINGLRDQVDRYEGAIASMSGQGENNPTYRSYQQQVASMQKQLDDALAERRVKARDAVLQKLEQQKQTAANNLKTVQDKVDLRKADMGELDLKSLDLMKARTDQEIVEKQADSIDKQIQNIENETRGKDLATVAWAQHPETPETPSFPPKIGLMMLGGGLLGLALSLGLAFSRELIDQSVRSPRDITRVGQMNLLGMITHEDDDPQAAGVPLPLAIFQAPTSIIAEQFRQVRTRLQHASSLDTTRSLLVTSPGPGDGKTTIACNLAAGLSLNGRRILLVDANFRRPQLHTVFKVSNDTGFSVVLGSLENFETAVQQTSVPNLDVLTTGPKPANPTELMESQLLIDFIEKALEEYDHVIFDSGPLLFVSETVALAPRVDGVVSVVRARANSRGLLQRMRDGLRQLKAEHLGIILNAVRAQGGGYYGRNIKTYYEYQNGHAS